MTTTDDRDNFLAEREAELRAEAPPVIPPCPSWCVSTAALHRFEFDVQDGDYVRTHTAYESTLVNVEAVERSDGNGGPVTLSPPEIKMYGYDFDGVSVKPASALVLAAELRKARDVLDQLTAPTTTDHAPIGPIDYGRMTHPSVEVGSRVHETALQLRREAPDFASQRREPFYLVMMRAELRVEEAHGKMAAFALRSVCQALVDYQAGRRGITPKTWERYVRMIYAGDYGTALDGLFGGAHWTWTPASPPAVLDDRGQPAALDGYEPRNR
jgi:hypothetical protein